MATKTIITRIKNKVDTLAAWQSYTGTLLDGEIAVVRVPTGTSYTNPITGKSEPVVELLMKVGDGSTSFANLPWMSAKASDVYDWAKAATVEFNTTDNKIYFKQANGTSIANIDLSSLASKISALESKKITVTPNDSSKPGVVQSVTQGDATNEIDVTYGLIQTADIDAKQVTAAKIADSTITATQLANGAVTNGKIADSAVTNAKLGSDISSDKINVGTGTTAGTLSKKLSEMDAAIASKAADHNHDAYINQNAFSYIKVGSTSVEADTAKDTVEFVGSNITITPDATNDKVTFSVASANTTTPGIAKLGANGGAATYASVFGTDGKGGINAQIETNTSDIASLKATVTKGIIFRGEVASAPSGTTYTLNGTSTAVSAIVGDMVICGEKEYVYTASSTWKELGDLSRVGTLETWRNKLVKADTAVINQFVTEVDIAADGTVTINRARPTSTDVEHGTNSTVKDKLDEIDAALANRYTKSEVYTKGETDTAITTALDKLDVTADPTSAGKAAYNENFVVQIRQNNGQVSYSRKTLPTASTSDNGAGIVQLTSATNSTSETLAATPKAVKAAYDLANTANAEAASKVGSVSLASGTNNGTLKLTVDGTATDNIAVKGLGSAAYTDSGTYAPKSHASTATTYGAGTSSKYGHVKLSDSTSDTTSGTSSGVAATPKAVNLAYQKGADAAAAAAAIAGNYVKVENNNLVTQSGDVIVFDCGGAD